MKFIKPLAELFDFSAPNDDDMIIFLEHMLIQNIYRKVN